jgi:hypothetical protein
MARLTINQALKELGNIWNNPKVSSFEKSKCDHEVRARMPCVCNECNNKSTHDIWDICTCDGQFLEDGLYNRLKFYDDCDDFTPRTKAIEKKYNAFMER